MDKEFHTKESRRFCKANSCYIHTEMEDGKHPRTVLCGDFMAMLHCVNAQLNRICELTDTNYVTTLDLLQFFKEEGYSNVRHNILGYDDREERYIKGEDYEEKLREEITKEVCHEVYAESLMLQNEKDKIARENKDLRDLIQNIRLENEKKLSAKDKQIKELSKEILKAEHQIKEITKLVEEYELIRGRK